MNFRKTLYANFFLFLILFVSSCSYNNLEIEKKKIIRKSDIYQVVEKELEKAKNRLNRNIVIVIDPGHGGKDPGAVGLNGTLEKEINLKFSKILKADLSSRFIKVKLTRTNDKYLYLYQRVKFAERNKADLLVSIHSDASKNKKAQGFSIFSLSDKASDKEARKLALRENKSDFIGGLKIRNSDPFINDNLIKIFQRETMNESSKLAGEIIGNMKRLSIKNRGHRNAGFVVLKSFSVPSVLVELGFITNKNEEKLLNNKRYLKKISKIISLSILDYLNKKN